MDLYQILMLLLAVTSAAGWWREKKKRGEANARLATFAAEQQKLADAAALVEEERRILEMVSSGASLQEILDSICIALEHQTGDCLSSIMLLDEQGKHLLHGSAPHLPQEYCQAIHGITVGDGVGSCGTAAFLGQTVIVKDISTDWKWAPYKDLARRFELGACWSFPIRDSQKKLVGTFGQYHRVPTSPTDRDMDICRTGAHLASIAIENRRSQESLRRDKERMDVAERAARFGVWEIDTTTNAVSASQNLLRLMDADPSFDSSILGNWRAIIHPDDLGEMDSSFQCALKDTSSWSMEFRIARYDGVYHWFRSTASIARDAAGKPIRVTGTLQDVTAEKELLLNLEQAKLTAEAATRVKSRFLANMSHEIRTPLNGIIGSISLLRELNPTEEQRPYLDTIRASGESLLHVVNDVLDFSKIEAGKIELEIRPFALSDLLREVESIVAPQARALHLGLTFRVDPACLKACLGDSLRLRQILLNLVSNAIKFTPQGSVDVEVIRLAGSQAHHNLLFRVSDTGIGMSPDVQAAVFEPFTQADTSTTRSYGGSGLGLTICRHLVELMGGRIRFSSIPGTGTTFEIEVSFPIASASPKADRTTLPQIPSSRALHILVAEDNSINQKVAQNLLQRLGHSVDVVSNGKQVLEAAAHVRYDAILMDCQMPEMDGIEATARMRQLGSDIQIIALTANAFAEDKQRCLAAGMDQYLTKPITLERLREVLEETILMLGTRT